MEGPIALTECATHDGCCSIESHCGVRGNWRLINTAIQQALDSVSLEQMAAPLARMPERARHEQPLPYPGGAPQATN